MPMPSAQQVVALAQTQIGTKGGSKYWAALGYSSAWYTQPWCACFVDWVLMRCGCPLGSAGDYPLNCGNIQTRLQSRAGATYVGKTQVKAGDILVYEWDGKGDSYDHVGIATGNANGTVPSVEGNASNQVKACVRSVGYVRAVLRPAYASASASNAAQSIKEETVVTAALITPTKDGKALGYVAFWDGTKLHALDKSKEPSAVQKVYAKMGQSVPSFALDVADYYYFVHAVSHGDSAIQTQAAAYLG